MLLVTGKSIVDVAPHEFAALTSNFRSLHVDVGTGDGRVPYRCAIARPDEFFVGMDPNRSAMEEIAAKSRRKPSRGGATNTAYVCASIEAPPGELCGRADRVSVIMPWGRLLAGLVVPIDDVLRGIRLLGRDGTQVDAILNAEVWRDPRVPTESLTLPEASPDRFVNLLRPRYAAVGLELRACRVLTRDEANEVPSTWTRRLSHGRLDPRFLWVRFMSIAPNDGRDDAIS